jgi:protein TonB
MAQQRRQEGTAVVSFRLTPSGELVAEPVVSRSSGYRQLDDAAVRAVSRGAPYPRFPLDPNEMRAIEIPVKFYLR